MTYTIPIFFLIICLFTPFLSSAASDRTGKQLLQEGLTDGITVDLRDPLYTEGVLTTDKGGVVTGPGLRIQALKIRYVQKLVDGVSVASIEAEDRLIIRFGEYTFVGKKLIYDFEKQEGIIYQGTTGSGPWFFGGEQIELRSDKSYIIYNGYVTTSENKDPEWEIFSKKVHIFPDHFMNAKNVNFKIFNYSVLWVPSLKVNLDFIFDSPVRYRFRWGGRQGPRFGLTYELFSAENWKTFVRFDYRLTRGPGGGFEAYYESPDKTTDFTSINYVARDSSLLSPHEKLIYRFEGIFNKSMDQGKTTVLLTYDKISDLDMPAVYYDRDFDFETSARTQLLVRRQEDYWISNFYSRIRVNNFQTVKEELPTFGITLHPFSLGSTGIILENYAKASFLNFKYANHLANVRDYSSTRFDYRPTLYRPLTLGPLAITPQAGAVAIAYGNSPDKEPQLLALGVFGYDLNTRLYNQGSRLKHVIEPYASYRCYTKPTITPPEHYIFDIEDGWYGLNKLTFGTKNALYAKTGDCISRLFRTELFAHAFFRSEHIKPTIPKMYGRVTFFTLPTMQHTLETAWDFRRQNLSYFTVRMDWTVGPDLALSMEYRQRNAYSWRKADQTSFFLESFHSEHALRKSALSDQRETLLVYGFYRFHPDWALALSSRQGWNRLNEPDYTEYEIDLLTTIQSAWHLKFSFQHQENDNRFAVYVNLGLAPPIPKDIPYKCYFE